MITANTDKCNACGKPINAKDWTCPKCGEILDRFLFSTVTSKSVTGADKDAFWTGHGECMKRWKASSATALGEYHPITGHETAYRAGWHHAVTQVKAKKERARGRRRGLELLGIGVPMLGVGIGIFFYTKPHLLVWYLFAAGGLAVVLGTVMLILGVSDV